MDMLKTDIKKLYRSHLVSSLSAAVVTSVYSFVDMIAIGQGVGPDGAAAFSIATPIYGVVSFLGLLFGVGSSVYVGKARGEGNMEKSNAYFSASLLLVTLFTALVWIGFIVFSEQIYLIFGANETLLPLVKEYTDPVIWTMPLFIFSPYLSCVVRIDGAPNRVMAAVITGGVFNVFGDWFFVFPLKWGMTGTVLRLDRSPGMKRDGAAQMPLLIISGAILLILLILLGLLELPAALLRPAAVGLGTTILLLTLLWKHGQEQRESDFANSICDTLDALLNSREPENDRPYEDSQQAKVQGKLLQYHDYVQAGQRQSEADKQNIQELVSDISHQVKTPIANIRMFTDLLCQHQPPAEKRAEFLSTLSAQVNKLDFLMQSLLKTSRLETGTFVLRMEDASLYDTIAQAVGGVLTAANRKRIQIDVDCAGGETLRHDPRWTAEALGNLLDNAVKYTPEGGSIRVSVRPWQFYTRIDITDTGIGVPAEHYHDVFKRFYRGQSSAEGVGLGLYLARGIITRQRGYITLKSEVGKGSTFSVFLLR